MPTMQDHPRPRDPLAPHGQLSLDIDMTALRAMPLSELQGLRATLDTLGNVIDGFMCQPKFAANDHQLNAAGEALGTLAEFFSTYEQAILNVVQSAKPTRLDDVQTRAWTLLRFGADMGDSLLPFAHLAVEVSIDEAHARQADYCAAKRGAKA